MAKRATKGKLVAKTIENTQQTPIPGADDGGLVDFPDALAYIRSLGNEREGVEWNIRVYKVDSSGRGVRTPQQFLFSVELEDLPNLENVLAEQYPPGGSFKVVVRANGQIVRSAPIDIAPRPGYKPPLPAYLQPVTAHVEQPSGGDRLELFFTRMMEVQERSAQQTRDLIAAIAAKPAAPAPSFMDQIQLFTKIQELMPKGAQENTMAMFEKGMEFASKLFESRGGDGGGATWLDVVKEALASPAIKDLLETVKTEAAARGANNAALPPPVQSFFDAKNPIAVNAMDTLLRQAAANVDPKTVAEQLFNQLPPAVIDELEQQSDVVGYLISKFPQATQHRAWLLRLVAEMWEPENTPAMTPGTQDPHARPSAPQQQPQT